MVVQKGKITITEDFIINKEGSIEEPTESLGSKLFNSLKKHGNKIAQIDAKTGQEDTFSDLLSRCVRTALHMSDKNINRDDIISICTNNHLNSAVPYIATQFLGAKVACLDPSFSRNEIYYFLKEVQPKMLFVTSESVNSIEKVLENLNLDSEIVVFGRTKTHTEFSHFLKSHQKENYFEPITVENLRDTAVIHFSSGTTGLPKGICLSHYAFVGHSMNTLNTDNVDHEYMKALAARVSFPFTNLAYTSLYWISAGKIILSSAVNGFCRLICEDFDGREIWRFIQKYKPAVLLLTPIQVMEMLANKQEDVDVGNVLNIIVIGAPISKKYNIELQQAFPEADVTRGYGLTEVSGLLTTFRGNDIFHRPLMKNISKIESVGLPVKGMVYKVVDPETEKNLGPNQCGELRIKSPFIMNGYYNRNSSEAFDSDGWLKTGDIVYYDEDICFYIVDRIKEAFKYKGWFIAPVELESHLLEHPAVKQAVVIGIPKEDGCHAMGLVIIKENLTVTEHEIEKFVENRVSERQRLRAGVKFIKTIPLTVTGKVKRKEIRDMVLQGRLLELQR